MDARKIRKIARPIKVVIGLLLISYAINVSNPWYYFGVIFLLAGIVNFCPMCVVTKQCKIING